MFYFKWCRLKKVSVMKVCDLFMSLLKLINPIRKEVNWRQEKIIGKTALNQAAIERSSVVKKKVDDEVFLRTGGKSVASSFDKNHRVSLKKSELSQFFIIQTSN